MSEEIRDFGKNMRVSVEELEDYQWCIDHGYFEPHRSLVFANIAVYLLQMAYGDMEYRAVTAEYVLREEKERADRAEAELRAIRRILDGDPSSDDQPSGRH